MPVDNRIAASEPENGTEATVEPKTSEDSQQHQLPSIILSSQSSFLDLEQWSNLSQQPQRSLRPVDKFAWHSTYQLVLSAMSYNVKIIDHDKIEYLDLIGVGANMSVYKGQVNGRTVALKKIRPFFRDTGQVQDEKAVLASLDMEMRVMSDVFLRVHENIANLEAFSWDTRENDGSLVPILIMELAIADMPTLEHYMQRTDPRDYRSKAWIVSDIISGLDAIHKEKIVHGDLKPENILLFHPPKSGLTARDTQVVAKISDFGFCEDIHEGRREQEVTAAGGTEYWNAPECMPEAPDSLKVYSRKVQRDVYSCGLVIWYILSHDLPLGPTSGPDWRKNRQSLREAKVNDDVPDLYREWFEQNLRTASYYPQGVDSVIEMMLFPNKVWLLTTPDGQKGICSGNLSREIPKAVFFMLKPAHERLSASAALKTCKKVHGTRSSYHSPPTSGEVSEKARIHDQSRFPMATIGEKEGWSEWEHRFQSMFAPVRGLKDLTPTMRDSLIAEMRKHADGPTTQPATAWMLQTIYSRGYGVPVDMGLSNKYAITAVEAAESTRLSDEMKCNYMSRYYNGDWLEQIPLPPQKELSWGLTMFSEQMKGPNEFETSLSRALFEERLAVALNAMGDWKAIARFLNISAAAYVGHQNIKACNRNDPILRKPDVENAIPDYRGNWVNVLLRDQPSAFEALQQTGALPPELQLTDRSVLSKALNLSRLAISEALDGKGSRGDQAGAMKPHTATRVTAEMNLISICAEHGLRETLKHLASSHNVDINRKLQSGRSAIQEVLEQGRIHCAIALLACGADLRYVSERDFIRHICGDGHYQAINFWSQLRDMKNQLIALGSDDWRSVDHYRQIVQLFEDSDNLNLDIQSYKDDTWGFPTSPIYFSIFENCWLAFIALLRYGVDPGRPCMGSLNALEASVVLVRPMFVATLCGPEYERSFHVENNEDDYADRRPSLLHLALLGPSCFSYEKKWVYCQEGGPVDTQEIRAMDEPNHQRLILELLTKNLDLDLEEEDEFGLTPFLLAISQGNLVTAQWLTEHGCETDGAADDDCNAIHLAIASGCEEVVEFALHLGDEYALEHTDKTGQTPLHFAASQPNLAILVKVLAHSPDLEVTDSFGRTAFLVSLEHRNMSHLAALVRAADTRLGREMVSKLLSVSDSFGRTCYHFMSRLDSIALRIVSNSLSLNIMDLQKRLPSKTKPVQPTANYSLATFSEVQQAIKQLAGHSCVDRSGSQTLGLATYPPEFRLENNPGKTELSILARIRASIQAR